MNDEQNTDPDAELARMQHMGEEEPQSNPVVRMDTSLVLVSHQHCIEGLL
jgi:hypothetical protein